MGETEGVVLPEADAARLARLVPAAPATWLGNFDLARDLIRKVCSDKSATSRRPRATPRKKA
jgi:hypothetical protein